MRQVTTKIKIIEIINKFDVRKALNDDHIIQLAELIQNGVKLPPILVIALRGGGYAFVDGRHRAAAHALLNIEVVEAVVKAEGSMTELQLMAEALKSNWGGALPPNQEDIRHTIIKLIEDGAKEKVIAEALKFLPHGMFRRYMKDATSVVNKRNTAKALEAIADGMNIPDAAKRFKLKEDSLRDAIMGRKRKWGGTEEIRIQGEARAYINTAMRSVNNGIGKKIQVLIWKVEHGEIQPSVAAEAIELWASKLNGTMHRLKDWRERLQAAIHNPQTEEDEPNA
jgi:ParB-like nuclease domain